MGALWFALGVLSGLLARRTIREILIRARLGRMLVRDLERLSREHGADDD